MSKKRKKRKVRTKRSWIVDIPIGVCIFFAVVGIIIGNVFIITTWHEGKLIDKNKAIPVSATFESYTLHHSPKGSSLNEVEIYFNDHEKLYIDGAFFNIDVESVLDTLQSGDRIDLLLHPNSDYIWEMKCDETVVLSFEDAKTRMRSKNIAFSALGAFGYLCAGLGVVSLVLQFKERRRKLKY